MLDYSRWCPLYGLPYDVDATMLHDWARIMDIEFIHIDKDSAPEKLKQELLVNGLVGKLK